MPFPTAQSLSFPLPNAGLVRPEPKEGGASPFPSLLDPSRFVPARLPADLAPRLVTLVDAEEGFDWSRPFSRAATDVSSMRSQWRAHLIFERHGVVPTYLVNHPVAENPDGYRPLQELLRDGACEIGAHLHPWVNPPYAEPLTRYHSFAGNLPPELEIEKLAALTQLIGARFATRPVVYRAGRYGIGPHSGEALVRLGYRVDTSVAPYRDFRREGGPAFFFHPTEPTWTDASRRLMELPLTSAVIGPLQRRQRWMPHLFGWRAERAGVPSLLRRLGLIERIKLTPEGIQLEEAMRLVRTLHRRGQRVFVLSYHSPSLAPGAMPYVRTDEDLQRFLGWLDSFYSFFASELGGRPATARQIHDMALVETLPDRRLAG